MAAGLLLTVLLLYLGAPLVLETLGRSLIEQDSLQKADVILVLGGDDQLGNRVSYAVKLFQEGYAPLLMVSGQPIAWETHGADIMKRQALALGVPEARLIAMKHSPDSTKEEAAGIVPELLRHEVQRVILVTSTYHTRRAKKVFAGTLGAEGIQWIAAPAQDDSFSPERWWTRRRDARTFFYEGTKTIWYWFAE
jgi:uncharacterized SAM-binding protein YcdF (DUF218 family)